MLRAEQIQELARRECAEIPGAAVVAVDAVTEEGKAHCTTGRPSAQRLIGVSGATVGELSVLFRQAVIDAVQLDRLVCGAGVFEFTGDRVVIRVIGPQLTARDVQEVLPFAIYAGPDLRGAADRLAD